MAVNDSSMTTTILFVCGGIALIIGVLVISIIIFEANRERIEHLDMARDGEMGAIDDDN